MRLQLVTLAAGVAVVTAVHLVPVRLAMERHLLAESRAALAAEGLTGVDVAVTGLEARLTGSVVASADVDRALRAVVAVDAVASVEASLDLVVADAPTAGPPGPAPAPSATAGDTAGPPAADPPAAPPPTTEVPATEPSVEEAAARAAAEEAAAQASSALAAVPTITFVQNSVVLTPEGEESVALIAGVIAAAPPTLEFRIEAHSDLAGPDDFNKQLSIRRAATVRSALIGLGISRARLTSAGLGESAPLVVPEVTVEDRLANRRVEVVVEIAGEVAGARSGDGPATAGS